MEGGTHSELMHSKIFTMKSMHPLNLNSSPLSISVQDDESDHQVSFWSQREAEKGSLGDVGIK